MQNLLLKLSRILGIKLILKTTSFVPKFRDFKRGFFLVEVVVFGQIFKAVLDTGASKSAFDMEIISGLAPSDQIIHIPDQHAIGLGTTTMERYVVICPELKLGELIIEAYEAPVFDLSAIKFAYEKLNLPPVIGVIGGDILMDYKGIINYKNLTLTLSIK
mgnify:CR=1 FL=1